MEMFYPFILK